MIKTKMLGFTEAAKVFATLSEKLFTGGPFPGIDAPMRFFLAVETPAKEENDG